MKLKNLDKKEPFQYYSDEPPPYSELRLPNHGIRSVPHTYHLGQTTSTTDSVPETGFTLDPLIDTLITDEFPRYRNHVNKYCRPLGTTDATFADFNKPQFPTAPLDPARVERILPHIFKRLDATPYLPVHFVDTQFAKLPLSTGTGYHNRTSYKINAHAKYSHPDLYASKHTSKGYYINAFLENARTLVHKIKDTGLPFDFSFNDTDPYAQSLDLIAQLNKFMNEYPTMLFTRNHISDRDGNLKQRPVYAVDDLFLLIETMLTFPLLVQARSYQSCIMYGLETIRGSNAHIDKLAQRFRSFFTIDWSEYDQRLPRSITDLYYTRFLRSLIVISHGYQPTFEYQTYPDLTEDMLYDRMDKLLSFLHLWYNNMTFLSPDGYAYRRTYAGVPSGLFNTQYLDSFGNLYLIIDGLIEFGCTDEEIQDILLFIMGDDNSGFTNWALIRLEKFITFFEAYALQRYNMKLSKTKSVITNQRDNIETLGYQCNFGLPVRPIPKLVAQLCFPEHGMKRKYMAYRAIAMPYVACASNRQFHQFCRAVYTTFLPFAAPLDEFTPQMITKYLPGVFKSDELLIQNIDFTHFPTMREVINKVSHWQGPLGYAPKWNFAHFINAPNVVPPSSKTMYEYMLEHKLKQFMPPLLPI